VTRVAILLYEGFDELDAVGPYEVFQQAARHGDDLTTALVTVEPRETVTAANGLTVATQGTLSDPAAAGAPDLLVVPGGGWTSGAAAGARAEVERGVVPEAVAAHHEAGATVASVCTGAMLLASAGLLAGRPATTHHGAIEDLRETGAAVREERVVDDGDVVTAGGVTSGIDLALHLVERLVDRERRERVARTLEYRSERGTDTP
jgi:transcriptional regulator GlxA family with amidase domain